MTFPIDARGIAMDLNGDAPRGGPGWVQQGVWAVVAVVGSVLLGNACIVLGGLLAMALESGSGAAAGRAIGAIALALMAAAYSLLLVLIMRVMTSGGLFPAVAGLGMYPGRLGSACAVVPRRPLRNHAGRGHRHGRRPCVARCRASKRSCGRRA